VLLNVTIKGKGGHNSRPDQANSPIDCFAAVYNALQASRMKYISPYEPATFALGMVRAGTRSNIIPDELSFSGSYRFTSIDAAKKMAVEATRLVEAVCEAYNCRAEADIKAAGMPAVNDPQCVAIARDSIEKALGPERVCAIEPWMASDTFGLTAKIWPGIYALVGIKNPEKGTGREHHNSAFEVDEDALVWGAASSAAYALGFLSSGFKGEGAQYKKTLREFYDEADIPQWAVNLYGQTGVDLRGLDRGFV
jgi:amidohydrolase